MKHQKSLKWGIGIGIVIVLAIALSIVGYMYTKISAFNHVFADNVYIEDLAVGGLTKEEAKSKLEQLISEKIGQQTLVLTHGEVSREIPLNMLEMTYNIDESIDEAFKVGHEENFIKKYQFATKGSTEKQTFVLERVLDDTKIEEILNGIADQFSKEPVNATLNRVNRQFVITPSISGEALNVSATKEKVLEALNAAENEKASVITVEVVLDEIPAEYTEEDLKDSQTLVASFSTSFNNASPNRNANLAVACDKITRTILPNEIFKLSDQLEPFTTEAGYRNAGVIVNGKVEDGIGGGVCQVASTLYNAVLMTELEIVMRQNHSLSVSYVPLGRDATYSTGSIDFQFKNNSDHAIYIEGYCENNQVIINIYGYKTLKSPYDIKFESELIETIPAPATTYKDDASLEEGQEETETTAIDGKRVKLYKLYYQNGKLVNKVLVNTSYYRPRGAVIKRGTKKVEVPEEKPEATPNDSQQVVQKPTDTPAINNTNPPVTESQVDDVPQIENTTNDSFAVEQQ